MKENISNLIKKKPVKYSGIIIGVLLILFFAYKIFYPIMFEAYTGVENATLTFENSKKLSDTEFEALAKEITYTERYSKAQKITSDEKNAFTKNTKIDMLMNTSSFMHDTDLKHIKYFRKAGIRQYEGPHTCLQCHETIMVNKGDGNFEHINTMDDIVNSVHFMFQTMETGFSTYGYDGRQVNSDKVRHIPVGKINRACGIPGSFSWTGWAKLIESKPEYAKGEVELRSEGCGQCHMGGNYHPATEKMMPIGDVPSEAKEGIDCLICHSKNYDMNQKYVIEDKIGTRWNQDRSMKAALSVTWVSTENCLNCHQHNFGGDAYIHNVSAKSLGYKNKRILHEGAKRGNPFSPQDDVHAAAGIKCTDCHIPEGHKIPRGNKATDLVTNDIPGKVIACENCHTSAPHTRSDDRVILNGHVNRLACETCHITKLEQENVVLRDWIHPTWNEEEGIYIPTDVYRSGEVNKGFTFLWFNGNGTFLANALGNNPINKENYDPFMIQMSVIDNPEVIAELRKNVIKLQKIYPDIDVDEYVRMATQPLTQLSPELLEERKMVVHDKLRPIMDAGESKIYPFKMFNAIMYEDMGNQGPFGAMILPFDYPSYYETGNPTESVKIAISNPIVKRMYELPFKMYMMDEFMYYFGVDGWNTDYPLVDDELQNVEAHWMRQMGTLTINHGIEKGGYKCNQCHARKGIMNFELLGYPADRVKDLENLPELKYLKK